MKPKRGLYTQPTNTARDLIVLSVAAILVYGVSSYFDAFEVFLKWYQEAHADEWQLDEIVEILIVLTFALTIFSIRRWKEVRRHIIEREQILKDLAQSRDAALESARLKSEFLANMSHEIRTPMNGIIGMTELTLDTALDSEQREYLMMVKTSAESLMTIINDILDFSKIESGKLVLDKVDFSLRHCLGNVIKSHAISAHEKQLGLVLDISEDLPDHIVGDPVRLSQIMINLVGNAIKFTQKGEVIVRAQKSWQNENEICLHLSVIDTGIGIAKSQQKLIFSSFTQADGSSTRIYGGTGLGLAISTQLAQMNGGEILVESELGQGSTFHFLARFGLQAPKSIPLALASTAGVQSIRV